MKSKSKILSLLLAFTVMATMLMAVPLTGYAASAPVVENSDPQLKVDYFADMPATAFANGEKIDLYKVDYTQKTISETEKAGFSITAIVTTVENGTETVVTDTSGVTATVNPSSNTLTGIKTNNYVSPKANANRNVTVSATSINGLRYSFTPDVDGTFIVYNKMGSNKKISMRDTINNQLYETKGDSAKDVTYETPEYGKTNTNDLYGVFEVKAGITYEVCMNSGTGNGCRGFAFKEKVVAVTLDKDTLDLRLGKTATLTATKENIAEDIEWSVEPENVVDIVSNGDTVTLSPAEGATLNSTATVTATAGDKSASCTVTIRSALDTNYWKNNGVTQGSSSVTIDTEDNAYVLNYGSGTIGSGFSYDLYSIMENRPNGFTAATGSVIVSCELYIPNDARENNLMVDVSGETAIANWGGGQKSTYGRIATNSSWLRYIGGQNSTTNQGYNGTLKTDEWIPVTFKINFSDGKNITISYNNDEKTIPGFATSIISDAMYLNIQPSTNGSNNVATTKDVIVKVKNISATYQDAAATAFGATGYASGYYTENNQEATEENLKLGVIRYFQEYTGANVSAYGFYFVNSEGKILDAANYINSNQEFDDTAYHGFYGDLVAIAEENWEDTYYAKAYVIIDGVPYFSNQIILGSVGAEPEWVKNPATEQ